MKIIILFFALIFSGCITQKALVSNCAKEISLHIRSNGTTNDWEVVETDKYKKFTYFYEDYYVSFNDNFESCEIDHADYPG